MISRRDLVKMAGAIPVVTAGESYIGLNAYVEAPKGIHDVQQLAKVTLADGTEGLTVAGYTNIDEKIIAGIKQLIGMDPFSFYNWEGERIAGEAESMTGYFFDAVCVKNQP